MRRWIAVALVWSGTVVATASAAEPVVETVLEGVEKNRAFESRTRTLKITVKMKKRSREYQLHTRARGTQSTIEYIAPARDKGTRLLRVGEELWVYLPGVDRTEKLRGGQLRERVMDSDLSYEDLTRTGGFDDQFEARIDREEAHAGMLCWVVELRAPSQEATAPRRVLWVDQKTHVLLREEHYAANGPLLKTWERSRVREIDGRFVPMQIVVEDQTRRATRTTMQVSEVSYGTELEDELFTPEWLAQ